MRLGAQGAHETAANYDKLIGVIVRIAFLVMLLGVLCPIAWQIASPTAMATQANDAFGDLSDVPASPEEDGDAIPHEGGADAVGASDGDGESDGGIDEGAADQPDQANQDGSDAEEPQDGEGALVDSDDPSSDDVQEGDESEASIGDADDEFVDGSDGAEDGASAEDGSSAEDADSAVDFSTQSEESQPDGADGANASDGAGSSDDANAEAGLNAGASTGISADTDAKPDKDATEDPDVDKLVYEDDILIATLKAPKDALPKDATLFVEELHPVTVEKADAYGEALSSLANTLREQDKVYSDAKVYDIKLLDAQGGEIEPTAEVEFQLKYKETLALPDVGKNAQNVEVAHLTDDGDLQMMNAQVEATKKGEVESATFVTDGFSYYIVFSSNGTAQGGAREESLGNVGWLKFYTPEDGVYRDENNAKQTYPRWGHGTTVEAITSDPSYDPSKPRWIAEGDPVYRRVFKVNLWKLNDGGARDSYDDSNYTKVQESEYFWTWENTVRIDDFNLPGYDIIATNMHTARTDAQDDIVADSLIGTYQVAGHAAQGDDLINVLDVYAETSVDSGNDMAYVVRYVHADGSVSDGSVHYLSNGSAPVAVDAASHLRSGEEVYSGISIIAGADAVKNVNTAAGTASIQYDSKVDIAKVYVYYKTVLDEEGSATKPDTERYNKVKDGDTDKYYTGGEAGSLYTDKSIESVEGRDVVINLESWSVDKEASIGMVLDASGSMAWTAGVPRVIQKTDAEWTAIFGNENWKSKNSSSSVLDSGQLAKLMVAGGVLDPSRTDNSSMGYNGYHYYIYSDRDSIKEYVALGYTAGSTADVNGLTVYKLGDLGYAQRSRPASSGGAGWYYVNSSGNAGNYLKVTGKSYDGRAGNGPSAFYIDGEGRLCCVFCDGRKDGNNRVIDTTSFVYEKRDTMFTKCETLQDSVSQFGAILLGQLPESELAITRFSQDLQSASNTNAKFFPNTSYLKLLDWTSSTVDVAAAMNLSEGSTGGSNHGGMYEYGLTGQTATYTGVTAYDNHYNTGLGDDRKYLIIFTDGKDQYNDSQSSDADSSTQGKTGTIVRRLRDNQGYTIITVLMKSLVFNSNPTDYNRTKTFLQALASGGKNGNANEKLYFEADSDDAHAMVDEFRKIAAFIASRTGYSVRDYIDPRFDVVNSRGDVISVLDSDGNFTEGIDDNGYRGFTTPDGKYAYLGYDKTRKMFYVLWQDQNIPVVKIGSESLNPWKSQVSLRAKEDFLGGNDILTNGNETDLDLVYKPQLTTDSEGHTVPVRVNGIEQVDTNYAHTDFPKVSANPGLLEVGLGNYEDTIYLGEEITPGELFSAKTSDIFKNDARESHRVADTAFDDDALKALANENKVPTEDAVDENYYLSSKWYLEYLERVGVKLHGDKDYYGKIFQHIDLTSSAGVNALLTALKANDAYDFDDSTPGQVIVTAKETLAQNAPNPAAGEKITIVKTGSEPYIKVEVPYFYLQEPGNNASYAGDANKHGADKVGTITYAWTLKEFAGNLPAADTKPEANEFVEFDTYVDKDNHMDTTKSVKYQLKVSYTPDPIADAADGNDDGSARTKVLTGQTNVAAPLIRDAVGTQWTDSDKKETTDQMGLAVIHAVDGRILVEKKLLTSDFDLGLEGGMTLTLKGAAVKANGTYYKLNDDGTVVAGEGGEPETLAVTGGDEDVWVSQTVTLPGTATRTDGDYTYIYAGWATGLPVGTYTLSEAVTGLYEQKAITGVQTVEFYQWPTTPATDPAKPYADSAKTGDEAQAQDFKGDLNGAAWKLGSDPAKTPKNYADTDFTYSMVTDAEGAYKNTDAVLAQNGGKDYLNSQLGRYEVENAIKKADFYVLKKLEQASGDPTVAGGIEFSLFKAKLKEAATPGDGAGQGDGGQGEGAGSGGDGQGDAPAELTIADYEKDGDAIATGTTATGDQVDDCAVHFENLLPGVYILEEGEGVPNGWMVGGPWLVTVADGAVTSITGDDGLVTWHDGQKTATVLNKRLAISLQIVKEGKDDPANVPLEGATFELRVDNEGAMGDGSFAWYTDQALTQVGTTLTTALDAESGNALTERAYGIAPGSVLWINETSAPAGYMLAAPVEVVVSADGASYKVIAKDPQTGQYPADADVVAQDLDVSTGIIPVTIVDLPVYNLPAAGGPGVYSVLFAGGFIAALAAGIARTRRREVTRGVASLQKKEIRGDYYSKK